MEFTGSNEYASKGVGTAGLTLGIIGTALATLAGGGSLLNANNRSNGNGNGGSNGGTDHTDETCKLRSQVAKLEAEKYTDNAALDIRDRRGDQARGRTPRVRRPEPVQLRQRDVCAGQAGDAALEHLPAGPAGDDHDDRCDGVMDRGRYIRAAPFFLHQTKGTENENPRI